MQKAAPQRGAPSHITALSPCYPTRRAAQDGWPAIGTSWPGCGSSGSTARTAGIEPSKPQPGSPRRLCTSSALVFITNGPYAATGFLGLAGRQARGRPACRFGPFMLRCAPNVSTSPGPNTASWPVRTSSSRSVPTVPELSQHVGKRVGSRVATAEAGAQRRARRSHAVQGDRRVRRRRGRGGRRAHPR